MTDSPQLILKRPAGVTVIAALQLIGAAIVFITVLAVLGMLATDAADDGGIALVVVAVLAAGAGVLQLVCGLALLKLKPYGRTLMLVFAWIGLLGFPIGTIVSILILFYLFRPGIKLLFSGRPASDLNPAEVAQVQATDVSPLVIVLIVLLVVGLGVVVVGVLAAVAVPSLMSARVAGNEASAIASLRAINSGQMAYATSCGGGGYAITLNDLAKSQDTGGVGFVSVDLGSNDVVKSGYRIRVEPAIGSSPVASAGTTCNTAAGGSFNAYFAAAEPVTPGGTGRRYFATDSSNTIYESSGPITNPIVGSSAVRPVP